MAEPPQYPLVYIILLNYRGVSDTLACLESLTRLQYPHFKTIVVDNASNDGSVEALKQSSYGFHLIVSEENKGYSGGNNLGIQYALDQDADLIWLLNNDTTVDPNALTMMVEENKKTGGLVGSLLLYPDRSYQQVGTQITWSTGSTKGIPEHELSDGMSVDCLTGASMLIPKTAFKRVGLLDESYFLYFEDNEYTLRAKNASFTATVALRARVFHKEGASTGKSSLKTQYYYHRNRLKVLFQFATPMEKLTIALYTGFRVLRGAFKSMMDPSPDRKSSAQVQWLAVQDFLKGVSGPCPHNL
jgi:GT2 family glycosyltransferase